MIFFNGSNYIVHQTQILLEYFQTGGKIIEIGGDLGHDEILTQALPGYEKYSQIIILKTLFSTYPHTNLIYCISAKDLVRDKQFGQKYCSFEKYILKELALISTSLHTKPHIIITLMDDDFVPPHVRDLEQLLTNQGYTTEHYILGKPYRFSSYPTLVGSYNSHTGTSLLCSSSDENSTTRFPLPLSYNTQHPLNILAQAYDYQHSDHSNISVLENFITDPNPELYTPSCKKLVEERISLYEKLLFSGYNDEEEVETIKKLLLYFK